MILGIVWGVRTLSGGQGSAASSRPEPTAIEVLERRLAEGEISVEEYEQRRRSSRVMGLKPASDPAGARPEDGRR